MEPIRLSAVLAALTSLACFSSAQTLPATGAATASASQPIPVTIDVDLSAKIGPWKAVHRFYGCDEPNYAYMPNGNRLLGELGKTSPDAPVFFRTHNLMTTGDGTPALKWGSTNLYTEDADGKPIYDYTIVDKIFDAYLANGVRPYLQLGFMPEAMSTKPQPYQHKWDPTKKYGEIITGWAYPPKDYAKWGELCYQWTKHCVERYGVDEVDKWYFQTWNEPNGYWKGTTEEFLKLNDYALAGVRRALPTARVGGPDTAGHGGETSEKFLAHCLDGTNYATGAKGTPLDFVSFHAKGSPKFTKDGHVQMGITSQLRDMDIAFARFAKDPRTKGLPIVIGESDPEGCAACQGPQNGYRNGTMYSSYTAASFARCMELADKHGVNLEGVLTWAFLFEDQPLFAGFRVLASGPIDHPVLNVFRMYGQMKGDRVKVASSNATPLDQIVKSGVRGSADVNAIATLGDRKLAVMLWHYHDDDLPGAVASVALSLKSLPVNATNLRVTEQRLDATHGNAYTAWKTLGSPATPTDEQLQTIQAASKLNAVPLAAQPLTAGTSRLAIDLPRQGVTLVLVQWDVP